MTQRSGIHCLISGKVQGVAFRASTQAMAQQLGLSGFARNLSDGRVEVFAYGETAPLQTLADWLKNGPALAKVRQLTVESVAWQDYANFTVR